MGKLVTDVMFKKKKKKQKVAMMYSVTSPHEWECPTLDHTDPSHLVFQIYLTNLLPRSGQKLICGGIWKINSVITFKVWN